MAADTELYDLLGVEPTASAGEIRSAFRKLALTHHPDRGGDEETFTKVSKAYETLSDPKARARYDTSGRSGALTAEEELREAFFGGGLGASSSQADERRRAAGNVSSEERAKREAAEADRLEARRRLDESERRDAERRARLSGGAVSSTSVATNGHSSSAVPPARKDLAPGDRVELVDLKKTPELMGLTGTLVGSRDGRWQVRLDDGKGDKLIKEGNLKKLAVSGTSVSSQAKPRPAANSTTNGSANGPSVARGKAGARDSRVAVAKAAPAVTPVKTPMPQLPGQQYMVVHDQIFVRKDPSLTAEALGTLERAQYIEAFEETFDGWLRLESDDGSIGWALKDMRGKRGLGQLVVPYGREMQLPVKEIAESTGPHKFRVVFKPKVVVRDAPAKNANMIKIKQFGSEVMAVTQTYTGWIRLVNDEGWMLLSDPELGELLSPVFIEEQRTAAEASAGAETNLNEAIATGDVNQLQEAIKKAKAAKVSDVSMKNAETKLVSLHQEQGKRTEMRQRIDAAVRNEAQLRECIDECMKRSCPWQQEAQYAQKLLEQLQSEQQQTAKEHKVHLDELYQATLSGDPQVIKRVRDSAKKAGVPMKEIARVYALAQAAAASAAESVAQEETESKAHSEKEQAVSPYPPEVAKAAVSAAWGLTPEEAPRPDAILEASDELLSATETTLFDGAWYSKGTRTPAATISGLKLVTPEGEIQARLHSDRGIAFESCNETFQAEMDDSGQLVWSDGDIWYRSDAASLEAPPPPLAEAPQDLPAAVEQSPLDVFDGYWIGAEDEHMATIRGLTIHWADGPPQELERLAEDTIRVELFGQVLSARLESADRLLWSDGDVWMRRPEPNE